MDLAESNLLHVNETRNTIDNVKNEQTKQDDKTQTSSVEASSKGA